MIDRLKTQELVVEIPERRLVGRGRDGRDEQIEVPR